jgi:uncharacterized protein YndB with AHSA1/START domain
MKKLNFSVQIDAPKEKVWEALWNDQNYRDWTTVFCEGSYMESDWKEGGKTRFLMPEGSGMYSTIDKLIKNEVLSFKHIGEIKNGEDQPIDDATKNWTGALESYYLKENAGTTNLVVELDITEDHAQYFQDVFPKGLQKVKEIAETKN